MLQLGLEKADQLNPEARRSRDGNRRIGICREDLLDVTMSDVVAGGCLAIPDHHYAAVVAEGQHRGGVGRVEAGRHGVRSQRPLRSQIERPDQFGEAGAGHGLPQGKQAAGHSPPFCT